MKSKLPNKPHSSGSRRVPAQELFAQQQVYRPQKFAAKRPRKSKGPWLPLLVFFATFVIGFAAFGWLRKSSSPQAFVLVELRAIDEQGYPVAAARVTVDEKAMGLTDSFGEWRRYLKMQPGQVLSAQLEKEANPRLRGLKKLKVPLKKTAAHEFEVKASIELKAQAGKLISQKLKKAKALEIKKEAAPVLADESLDETDPEAPDPDLQKMQKKVAQQPAPEKEESEDSHEERASVFFDEGLATIAVRVQPFRGVPANLLEKHQAEVLEMKLLPLLSKDLEALGIKTTEAAPWTLSLSYVPKKDQVGYIRSQVQWKNPFGQTEKTVFMAGYAKTFEETVRGISSLLRVHMKKSYWAVKEDGKWYIDEPSQVKTFWKLKNAMQLSDTNGQKFALQLLNEAEGTRRWRLLTGNAQPCASVRQKNRCLVRTESLQEAPPLLGWKPRKVRIQGVLPEGAEVFVAGFLARPSSEGIWDFWGHPGSNHKVLVLHQGQIIHSEIFVDNQAQLAVVKIPAKPGVRQARR